MGGLGSGRHSNQAPGSLEHLPKLPISLLRSQGLLSDSAMGFAKTKNRVLQVSVAKSSDVLLIRYPNAQSVPYFEVRLEHVECHYGGFRWYFRCSGKQQKCVGRCGVLYLTASGPACRGCVNLLYATQQNSKRLSELGRLMKLRGKLGTRYGVFLFDDCGLVIPGLF